MKRTGIIVAGMLAVFGLAVLLLRSGPDIPNEVTSMPDEASSGGTRNESAAVMPSAGASGPLSDTVHGRKHYDTGIVDDPRVRHTPDGKHVFIESTHLVSAMHDPAAGAERDLELLSEVISFYRMVFEQNPEAGDNESVMAALTGANARNMVFFPPDHPSLNATGELMDRWGTPYYFHPLSGKHMEVISLGADQKLGTDDDLIHTQRAAEEFFKGYTEKPDFGIEEESQ